MAQLPAFNPMGELPPRYAGSAILRAVYQALDTGCRPLVQEKLDELASCAEFNTMPRWLMERYCTYFNVDKTLAESEIRRMLAWRMTTIGGKYSLDGMLRSIGFESFLIRHNDKCLVGYLQTRRDPDTGSIRAVTDADVADFQRTMREYGPAHLRVLAVKERSITFGDTVLFGDTDARFGSSPADTN